MKKFTILGLMAFLFCTCVYGQRPTDKYRYEHISYAKSVSARMSALRIADPTNTLLDSAVTYFVKNACVGYLPSGTLVRFFQQCPMAGRFTLLPLIGEDTNRVYFSSERNTRASRFPSYWMAKDIVYVIGNQKLSDLWVSMHLARAGIQVYLKQKYPYDMQGAEDGALRTVTVEQSEGMLLFALADTQLHRRLDSVQAVMLAKMQASDKPFGTYFPNTTHVRCLLDSVTQKYGADEMQYREEIIWRSICFRIIDDFELSESEKLLQKNKFDAAFRKKKARKIVAASR